MEQDDLELTDELIEEIVICALFHDPMMPYYTRSFPARSLRRSRRHRDRGYALANMELMSEKEFKRMFRMTKLMFNELEIKLAPVISCQ